MKRVSLCGISIVLLAGHAHAKQLFVNNSGSPPCDDQTTYATNDADQPWCTLLRAVRGNADGDRNSQGVPAQAAQAGDTVHVGSGTYHYDGPAWAPGGWLTPLYESVNSGTSWSMPIVYSADGVVSLTVSANVHASTLGGHAEYVKWIGFTVNQATATFRNGLTTITADHVHFENLTLVGTYTALGGDNHAGIMLHGPRDNDCTGSIGDILVKNCRIHGFTGDSGRNDAGITMYCAAGGSSGPIIIENNEFGSGSGNGIYAKSSYTPASTDPSVIIRRNRFHGNATGIMSQAWSNWHVYQNLFHDNTTGMAVLAFEYYVGGAQPTGYVVANNTLVRNDVAFRLEGFCQDATDMVYRNNIAVDTTTNSIWGESAQCSSLMTKANYDFDYNLYSQADSFGNLYYVEFPMATWQSATYDHQDTHSAEGIDPLFTDPVNNQYTLQPGSPCREGGTNDGLDVLDLDQDGAGDDPITLGAYISGDECIGLLEGCMPPSCGTNGCEPASGENCENCPADCPTGSGQRCCSGSLVTGDCCADHDCSTPSTCINNVCQTSALCVDGDQDGYGSPASPSCAHPEPDCDDGNLSVYPGAQEVCNGDDDDCDSYSDEDWASLGSDCTAGLGACLARGSIVCSATGTDVECSGVAGTPGTETCNTIDDDCDGSVDEGVPGCCQAGETRPCYGGPLETQGVGSCTDGTQTCDASGWGACQDQVLPSSEVCDDQVDNDCNGNTDGQDPVCAMCADADQDSHTDAACGGDDCDDSRDQVHPGAMEQCSDGLDNNCDGLTDGEDQLGCAGGTGGAGGSAPDAGTGAGAGTDPGAQADEGGCSCRATGATSTSRWLLWARYLFRGR